MPPSDFSDTSTPSLGTDGSGVDAKLPIQSLYLKKPGVVATSAMTVRSALKSAVKSLVGSQEASTQSV